MKLKISDIKLSNSDGIQAKREVRQEEDKVADGRRAAEQEKREVCESKRESVCDRERAIESV